MTKIRVLYIHHSGQFGGAPRSLSYIIKNIDIDKYEAKLININEGPINTFFKSLKVDLEVVKGVKPFHGSTVAVKSFKSLIKNFFYLIPSIIQSYRILKENKADLIHLNSTCLFAFAIALKFLNRDTKIISHVREPLRQTISGRATAFFIKRFTHGVIAISRYDLSTLNITKNNFPKIVINNFVEESDVPKMLNKDFRLHDQLKIGHNDIIFLYLARFASSNGWKELIDMVLKIIPENLDFHFVLVGAHSKTDLEYISNTNIHLLPFQKDVSPLFLNADIFICPFVQPHFSRGIIEASYAGLPVIASNVGSVNELISDEKTGYLYDDFLSFRQKSLKLGRDKSLRFKMGEEGRAYAKDNFNLVKQCARTFSFYDLIISNKN